MTKTLFTHRVENVAKWKGFDEERARNMGAFGHSLHSYVDPAGSDQVAVSMEVTDLEGLRAFMASETSDAVLRRHGVIKPVVMFCGKTVPGE